MASACSNFRPNFWRPSTCANCYRPKSKHVTTQLSAEIESDSAQVEGRRVGVVKPYAVVEIKDDCQRRYSEPSLLMPSAVRGRSRFITSTLSEDPRRAAATQHVQVKARSASASSHLRRPIIPKRKAPPPPIKGKTDKTAKPPSPHPLRKNCSQTRVAASPLARGRTTTIAKADKGQIARKKKMPPQKPPRTLSTFISTVEQEALLQHLLQAGHASHVQNAEARDKTSLVADSARNSHIHQEHKSSADASSGHQNSRLVFTASELHSQMLELMETTLQSVHERSVQQMMCKEKVWITLWDDVQVFSPSHACYNGISMSIECVPGEVEEGTEHEMELSQQLEPHLHISLIRGCLLSPPPSDLPLPMNSWYLLRDCIASGPLAKLLREKRETLPSDSYTELALLCLVQVFSALTYLYRNGVCHRDVGLDSLCASQWGTGLLVRLTNFHYALHRTGPVTATTFVYGYRELTWLGGVDSRLPPEIMDTPKNTQTLDYSHTDCFAAGCLIYEILGLENPFEQDYELVYQHYSASDLPPLPSPLHCLAHLLLQRDTCRRLDASTALYITQALLWLPRQWLWEPTPETTISHYLSLQQAQLVSKLAQDTSTPSLPLLLQAHFLNSCDVPELIRALSVFSY